VVWRGAAPPAVTRDDVRGAAPPAAAQNGVGRGPSGGGLGGVVGSPSDSGSVRHGALLPAPVEGRRSGPAMPDLVARRWIRYGGRRRI